MRTALLVLLCVAVALAQGPTDIVFDTFPVGTAGNGTIWYQTDNFFTFENVQNPIQVQIAYNSGTENTEASICLNSNINFPVFGVNLESACPSGAYGTAANASEVVLTPTSLFQRKLSNTKSQFIGARMALSDDSDFDSSSSFYANIWVKPGQAGLVVTLPDQIANQTFQIYLTEKQCLGTTYPIGTTCQNITTVPANPINITLGAGAWQYYQWTVTNFNPTSTNQLSLQINGTDDDVVLYIQNGYFPSAQWFLNAYEEEDDGNTVYTILTPGTPTSETYFFGIYNGGDASTTVHFNTSLTGCPAGQFGWNCQHKSANTSDPSGGYLPLGATLTSGPATGTENNGTAWVFDYSDSDWEGDYAYFSLTNYPTQIQIRPFYIRVSVADNNDGNSAPGFFAKQGGYPSAQSNFYNVSTDGDVTHQIIIEIDDNDLANYQTDPDYVWYFAVQLPANFAIWVGSNCANNCDEDSHGACYCNGELCSTATANFTNAAPFYQMPTSLEDSAGACTCEDDAYDESFDCSTKNNPYLWLWILLIVIAVIIVVVIAVAVPAFFIYQQRQKRRSGYDVVDGGAYD